MHNGQRVREAVTDWLTSNTNHAAAKIAASSVKSGKSAARE